MKDARCLTWAGLRIHVTDSGEGEPLLLIMGLGGSSDMWQPFVNHLPGRRVITFDSPGTGRSSTPTCPVGIPALAQLAATVLAHVGLSRADILGYSYGGAVAQQLAVQHPKQVRRLVLAATTMGAGSAPGDVDASLQLASPARYYRPELFGQTAGRVYGGRIGRDPDLREDLAMARTRHPPTRWGYFFQLLAGMGWTSRGFARLIGQPTLVLAGDQDPLNPLANARELARFIPNSQLHVMHGAGHLLLLDEAADAGAVVLDFLSLPPSPPKRKGGRP